jgi:hypothetical protein
VLLAVVAACAASIVVVVAVVVLALAAVAVAAAEVDGSGEVVVGVGGGDGEADCVPAGIAGGLLGGVEQRPSKSGAPVRGCHLQIGKLRAAEGAVVSVLRLCQKYPASRLLARPCDEVGALTVQLLLQTPAVPALVLGEGDIEHGHLGLGDRSHGGRLGHCGECTWRVVAVLGGGFEWGRGR